MDVITLICTVIGAIAAIYGIKAYFKDHVEKGKEKIIGLKALFKANQKIAQDLKDSLAEYARDNNALYDQFYQNITFSAYIALLNQTLENDLSDTALENAVNVNPTESIINSMMTSLETQSANLLQVRNYFNLYFKLHKSFN